ncbi:MAG: hypothetical protein IKV57_01825 [Clostridia bacterium]|nr:hypothetical protein [Clostridia bacterium]
MAKTKPGMELRVADGIHPQTNRYYAGLAKRYMAASRVFLILMMLFLLVVLTAGSEYITYDNLTYLARDFDLTIDGGNAFFTTISYPRHESMKFAAYKTGMAAAGSDTLNIYDSGGIMLLSDTLNYTEPCMAVSDKYVLAYDLGGKEYTVYNTLTRVIRRQTDFKILSADMSDCGAFVLVTRSNETKYVVELYNEALNHTMSIYKDHYVMDAAVRDDGKRLVIVSALPEQTNFSCEVSFCAEGESEPKMTITCGGLLPLDVRFHPDDSFTVLCDSAVLFFDRNGELLNRYDLTGMTLVSADMADGYVALLGAENALGSENRVVVLDTSGRELFSRMYKERMQQVLVTKEEETGSLCAVLTSTAVLMMAEEGIVQICPVDDDDVLTLRSGAGGIMICTKDCMYPAVFAEETAEETGGIS